MIASASREVDGSLMELSPGDATQHQAFSSDSIRKNVARVDSTVAIREERQIQTEALIVSDVIKI